MRAVSKRRMAAALALGGLLTAYPAAAQPDADIRSYYSSVEPQDCLLFQTEPLGRARVCEGRGGFNLVLTEFDQRAALELVHPDWSGNAVVPATAVAPAFSWIVGKVAEWREIFESHEPVALILRLGVSPERDRAEGAPTRLLVLRIDRADRERTCLVGAVSGREGGNEAARAMADRSGSLPCLR